MSNWKLRPGLVWLGVLVHGPCGLLDGLRSIITKWKFSSLSSLSFYDTPGTEILRALSVLPTKITILGSAVFSNQEYHFAYSAKVTIVWTLLSTRSCDLHCQTFFFKIWSWRRSQHSYASWTALIVRINSKAFAFIDFWNSLRFFLRLALKCISMRYKSQSFPWRCGQENCWHFLFNSLHSAKTVFTAAVLAINQAIHLFAKRTAIKSMETSRQKKSTRTNFELCHR